MRSRSACNRPLSLPRSASRLGRSSSVARLHRNLAWQGQKYYQTGLRLSLRIPEDHRGRVAARLDWHAKRCVQNAELRGAPRIVPKHREVDVRIGETIVLPGMIRDISLSGAAIDLNTDALPFVGTRACGLVRATRPWFRLIPKGIAVQFLEPFTSDTFADCVRP